MTACINGCRVAVASKRCRRRLQCSASLLLPCCTHAARTVHCVSDQLLHDALPSAVDTSQCCACAAGRIVPAFIEWDVTSGEGPIVHPPPVLPPLLTRPSRAGAAKPHPVWGLNAHPHSRRDRTEA